MTEENIRDLVGQLDQKSDALADLIKKVKNANLNKKLREAFAELEDAVQQLELAVGAAEDGDGEGVPALTLAASKPDDDDLGPRREMELGKFMQEMGQSLVTAQRDLDERSRRDIRDSENPIPTFYRIPKLSAEVHFAFDTEKEEGLNVFFYKRITTAKEAHQQGVQFEVVAVPPPPEMLAELRAGAPRLALVLDDHRRRKLFEEIENASPPPGTTAAILEKGREVLTAAENRDRVVFLESDQGEVLLFYADDAEESRVGIWSLAAGDPPVLKEIFRFQVKDKLQDAVTLRDVIDALGDRQAAFLKR
jgi:hypothetical protein